MSAPAVCFHCGLPVPAGGRWSARLLGEVRQFCCAGCAAVAQTIAAGGFSSYYETRTAPAERAAALSPAAIYDEPLAQKQFAWESGPGEAGATLVLERVRCSACLWLIEQTLRAVPGVRSAVVNYATHRAQVTWDRAATRPSALIEAIRRVGYDAAPFDPAREDARERAAQRQGLWRLFVAGFGAMQVMMYAFPAYIDEGAGTLSRESESLMRWAGLLLTLPVIAFASGPFFEGAWRELKRLRPGLDTPIAIGIAAGFVASAWATLVGEGPVYFDSIAMLVFLLLGARFLESSARRRATRSLDRLARWSPSFAIRLAQDGGTRKIPAHELGRGDRVLVPPGERVPADGRVESGRSSVDESLLTGESRPVAKGPGAALVGGSVNREQPLVMRVERAGSGARAAVLARLVEAAAATRPRLVAGADRLASALTWVVLAAAMAAGLWHRDFWIAATVLVVACPCALALAAPIALTAATGQLAARGVALTRTAALEALERATDIVLDKTGTLTEGRFRVARVHVLARSSEAQCRALARALEASSRHPLAEAFAAGPQGPAVSEPVNVPGQGIEARVEGVRLRIGTEAFCRELCAHPPPPFALPEAAFTPVFLAGEEAFLAVFLLEDEPRPEAAAAVRALKGAGLRVHLLSGDAAKVAARVGARLGIETCTGEATPAAKLAYVARLQSEGRVVAMVGDGLNDAPVLARADVSFAMGAGADAAQLHSDFVLTGNALGEVPATLALARRAMRIVRQNFAWALAYNAIALPLAAAGLIGPFEAAVGMTASSFVVVLNALRVGRAREQPWKASSSSSLSPSRSFS
ncbi:MAG TPA: heavy metal translocating P-type ATPase [Burkholderiales bacterium]|jgi:Cu2+-exporting ATPase|nr:heavy metal translocating P-type ATPase [Burkholderiales bacterium]